jgi:twinkle protein
MIPAETIEEIKSKVDVTQVIGAFVKLKKHGANMIGLCPFHQEKSPSFTVSAVRGMYKCFGCGKSGDAISFLMEHESIGYVKALEKLAAETGVQIDYEQSGKPYAKPLPRLEKLGAKALEWFEKERCISNDTLLRLKVTEAEEFMPQLKKSVTAICFNYYRKGELVNIKYRGPEKSFKLEKEAELIFFNLDALEGQEECVIVEGEVDTGTMVECGIYNAIGVPNGTPPVGSKMNLQYLDNCYEEIAAMKKVIIAVDDDAVGRNLKEELARRIGKHKCYYVVFPKGYKDPNEILAGCRKKGLDRLGRQAVRDMIESAKPWPIEGIIPPDSWEEEVRYYFDHGYPPGAKSGIPGLDRLLTFFPGHLTMWTGIPGHGKDEYTNWVETSLIENQNWVWGIWDFEDPAAIKASKYTEKLSHRAFSFRKDSDDRMSREEFDRSLQILRKNVHFVNVNKVEVTMKGIVDKAKELVERYGMNAMLLNPWNYLEHKRNGGQSETEYTSEALTLLNNFLWEYGVHCFLIAHPTKMQKDEKGNYKIPTLYNINGSSHFYNKTHNGVCVYRNQDGTTDVYVQKVKWYWLGEVGWVSYRFNKGTRQYEFMTASYFDAPETPPSEENLALPAGNWKPLSQIRNTGQNINLYTEPNRNDDEPF